MTQAGCATTIRTGPARIFEERREQKRMDTRILDAERLEVLAKDLRHIANRLRQSVAQDATTRCQSQNALHRLSRILQLATPPVPDPRSSEGGGGAGGDEDPTRARRTGPTWRGLCQYWAKAQGKEEKPEGMQ